MLHCHLMMATTELFPPTTQYDDSSDITDLDDDEDRAFIIGSQLAADALLQQITRAPPKGALSVEVAEELDEARLSSASRNSGYQLR